MSWGLFTVPPGYRFRPTDEELLSDHLEKKNQGKDSQIMSIIPEIEVCKHEPRELPELAFRRQQNLGWKLFFFFFCWFTRAESWDSQGKWYFFAPREYKYPNSNRSNRTTGEGSWKVTSKDRDIKAPGTKAVIGRKRTLTFYIKRGVLKPQKTGWVIHEYYLTRENSDEQIGDFVVCCLKFKSDNSDHYEDAPFCYRGSCSMASNVANQAEENLASNEQVNVVSIPNGNDDEAETGGGTITEAEERLAFKRLGDALQIPIGNQHEFQGLQIDPCNLSTSVEGQADRINSSDMNEELLNDPEYMDSLFHPPAAPLLHQLHQSPMYTTNVHNDECRKRKYPFEDNHSSHTKKNNISTIDGDELVSNTTSNSENQAADVIPEGYSQPGANLVDSYPKQAQGDFVICRGCVMKNKSDKKDSLVSDEGEPDSTDVSNWKIQAAHKNDEPLIHQPQPLDDSCSSAVRSSASLELEAVLQANGTNDDCNKSQSTFGDINSCLEDKNEVSTCDEDETMDGVFAQLCDPPEVNLNSLFRPLQPQDYRLSIPQSPIYTKLGNVADANLCFGECNNWQYAFKKNISTNEEVHRQTKENMESAFYPFQPQDSALQSMMYPIYGDALHNIECNELQSSFRDYDSSLTKLLNTSIADQDYYSSDQTVQTPSIDSNLPKSLGRVYHGDSRVSGYDTNTEVAHEWVQYSSALAIGNTFQCS